jgi:hypothetical protein
MSHVASHGAARWLCLALVAGPVSGSPATGGEGAATLLRCTWPDGSSLGVIHRHGTPLALTAGAVAGARECATRSTQPATREGAAAWRFDWDDSVLGDTFRAELQPLPNGGFVVSLARPAASGPGRVRCGPVSLPARAELRPGTAACQESDDRSQALQGTWQALRRALLEGDPTAFRGVLAAQVELAEGASGDSPRVAASEVAAHLACVAALTRAGQPLAEWARARPHILAAPTGLAWQGAGEVSLGGYAGLAWEAGQWRLGWLNASRAVILRDCTPPPPPR